MRTRQVQFLIGASLVIWTGLAALVAPRLNLPPVTLAAAGVIAAVELAALAWAARWASQPTQRRLDHLDFAAHKCTQLGLLGTVAGFSLELRSLAAIHGGLDPAAALNLVGHMAFGFGTAMCSTFVGVLAYMLLSSAEHVLADA